MYVFFLLPWTIVYVCISEHFNTCVSIMRSKKNRSTSLAYRLVSFWRDWTQMNQSQSPFPALKVEVTSSSSLEQEARACVCIVFRRKMQGVGLHVTCSRAHPVIFALCFLIGSLSFRLATFETQTEPASEPWVCVVLTAASSAFKSGASVKTDRQTDRQVGTYSRSHAAWRGVCRRHLLCIWSDRPVCSVTRMCLETDQSVYLKKGHMDVL